MLPRSLSAMFAFLVTSTVGCGPDSVCDGIERTGCDDCAFELARCEFDGVEATEPSCDTCQARMAVLEELCTSGSEATFEEANAGMTCEVVEDGDG